MLTRVIKPHLEEFKVLNTSPTSTRVVATVNFALRKPIRLIAYRKARGGIWVSDSIKLPELRAVVVDLLESAYQQEMRT